MLLVGSLTFATSIPVQGVGYDSRQFIREASPLWSMNFMQTLVLALAIRQRILLTAYVVQMNPIILSAFGINWNPPRTNGADRAQPTGSDRPASAQVKALTYRFQAFYHALNTLSIEVTLALLGRTENTTMLSQPRVSTVSGGRGYIHVGRQNPTTPSSPTLATQGADAAIGFINTGIQLKVQPMIAADSQSVRLYITPTVNVDLASTTTDPSSQTNPTVQLPSLSLRRVQTTVTVPDRGTLLLGGLRLASESRRDDGVPLLSKVPYLNRLFKNSATARDERNLTIMITPTLVRSEEEPGGAAAGRGGAVRAREVAALAEAESQHLLDASARARQRDAAAPERGWHNLAASLEQSANQRNTDPADLSLAMRLLLADPAVVSALGGTGDFPLDLRGASNQIDVSDQALAVSEAALLTAGVHLADIEHAPVPEVR